MRTPRLSAGAFCIFAARAAVTAFIAAQLEILRAHKSPQFRCVDGRRKHGAAHLCKAAYQPRFLSW
jgi:hypothetical protein